MGTLGSEVLYHSHCTLGLSWGTTVEVGKVSMDFKKKKTFPHGPGPSQAKVCGIACDSESQGVGIADDDDNCVNDANSDQADSDGNGIGDACESAASSGDEDDGGDDKSDDDSSNKTLAYAALLAVALVGIMVIFGRENDK